MTSLTTCRGRHAAFATFLALTLTAVHAAAPQYRIVDLGVVGVSSGSQAFAVSPDGAIAVGRELTPSGNPAMAWTRAAGGVTLPVLDGFSYAQANGVNDTGVIVGTATQTVFGSGAVPVVWYGGTVTRFSLPPGQPVGRANAVNASGVAVGSVGSGVAEYAAIYAGPTTSVIKATTPAGEFMSYANGISDAGLVVGAGVDPNNAAAVVALAYDITTGTLTDLGTLTGDNGGIAFGASTAGYVVGTSSFNGYPDKPFIWTAGGGMVEIPLPHHTYLGTAYAVNEHGWAVGIASGDYAVPFLYVRGRTYPLFSLLPTDSGWDLRTNTSSSARGISADGTIVGTGVHNGQTHAYAMILVRANGAGNP